MTNESWETLVGKILRVDVVDSNNFSIETTAGTWTFYAEAECCAHAYIDEEGLNDLKDMVGQRIIGAPEEIIHAVDESTREHAIHWYKLQGHKSSVTLVCHVESNGYYGGRIYCSGFQESA